MKPIMFVLGLLVLFSLTFGIIGNIQPIVFGKETTTTYSIFHNVTLKDKPELIRYLNATIEIDKCSDFEFINNLTAWVGEQMEFIKHKQDCTQLGYQLCLNLTAIGCDAKLVTGWYGVKGEQRTLHRWVETPYFKVLDAQSGIESTELYDKNYETVYGWCHEYG